MTQVPDPQAALASIQEARAGLAGTTGYPAVYDLFYGAACALLVAGPGLPPPWSAIAPPVAMSGIAILVVWWRKRHGWWISGVSPRRARWVAFGLGAVLVALLGLTVHGRGPGPSWLYLVSGGLAFVASIAGSRLWMQVWRRELAEGVK